MWTRWLAALVLGLALLVAQAMPSLAGVEGGDPTGAGVGSDPGGWTGF